MKEVGLIIDLYLSSVLDKEVVNKAVTDLYSPLIRLLKVNKDLKISLNIPLSTLELLDKYGHLDLISDIKELNEKEKIEILGASPYNSLLTNFSKEFSENQIILNEYGIGYYLGSKQGFEGEPSIMLKGLDGFIPTDLVVSESLLSTLNDMGYRWVATDSSLLSQSGMPSSTSFNRVDNHDLVVVGVINGLNNGIEDEDSELNDEGNSSYSREHVIKKIEKIMGMGNSKVSNIYDQEKNETKVFKLGSNISSGLKNTFKEEFETIGILVEYLAEKNYKIELVKDLVKKQQKNTQQLDLGIVEAQVKYYDNKEKENIALQEIDKALATSSSDIGKITENSDFSVISMWNDDELSKIDSGDLHNNIGRFILLSKFICLDKYYYLKCVVSKSDIFSHASSLLNLELKYATGFSNLVHDKSTKEDLDNLVKEFSSSISSL